MLPKSVGVLTPRLLARTVSLPLALAVKIVDPLMPLLAVVNLISRRLIWPSFEPEPFIEVADLERAIEHSGNNESLIYQEQAVLQNIVQLSDIRIEEWMRPRTQFQAYHPPVSLADLNGSLAGQRLPADYRTRQPGNRKSHPAGQPISPSQRKPGKICRTGTLPAMVCNGCQRVGKNVPS